MPDQFVSLLRLRAAPPAVSPGFVRRAGLEDRLTAAAAHPVTLISAGPGDGKTLTLDGDYESPGGGFHEKIVLDKVD